MLIYQRVNHPAIGVPPLFHLHILLLSQLPPRLLPKIRSAPRRASDSRALQPALSELDQVWGNGEFQRGSMGEPAKMVNLSDLSMPNHRRMGIWYYILGYLLYPAVNIFIHKTIDFHGCFSWEWSTRCQYFTVRKAGQLFVEVPNGLFAWQNLSGCKAQDWYSLFEQCLKDWIGTTIIFSGVYPHIVHPRKVVPTHIQFASRSCSASTSSSFLLSFIYIQWFLVFLCLKMLAVQGTLSGSNIQKLSETVDFPASFRWGAPTSSSSPCVWPGDERRLERGSVVWSSHNGNPRWIDDHHPIGEICSNFDHGTYTFGPMLQTTCLQMYPVVFKHQNLKLLSIVSGSMWYINPISKHPNSTMFR